jgi:DNA invertase Pin-like site-specific DNA recombinase
MSKSDKDKKSVVSSSKRSNDNLLNAVNIIANEFNMTVDELNHLISNNKITGEKAIGYGRISTPNQNKDGQHSLSTQHAECQNFIIEHGFVLETYMTDICRGNNIDKLKVSSIPNKYSNLNLIISNVSRLCRNVLHGIRFIEECKKSNIIIHFVRDNLKTSNNNDMKRIIDLLYDAQRESEIFSQRLISMHSIKRLHGSKFGIAPYGYRSSRKLTGTSNLPITEWVENTNEQNIIKLINMLYFGSKLPTFYRHIRSIIVNKNYVLEDECNAIYYGNYSTKMIATFLNNHNLLNRNKLWNNTKIRRVINYLKLQSSKTKKPICYLQQDDTIFKQIFEL